MTEPLDLDEADAVLAAATPEVRVQEGTDDITLAGLPADVWALVNRLRNYAVDGPVSWSMSRGLITEAADVLLAAYRERDQIIAAATAEVGRLRERAEAAERACDALDAESQGLRRRAETFKRAIESLQARAEAAERERDEWRTEALNWRTNGELAVENAEAAERETERLAEAIVSASIKAGGVDPKIAAGGLSGPQVLLLADDLAEGIIGSSARAEAAEREMERLAEKIDEAFREGRVLDAWHLARAVLAAFREGQP